jgi:predicted RNA-binding protein with PIN domain
MELIVDGYNVIHGVPEWRAMEKKSLAEARKTLEGRLASYHARHSEVAVLVYWDGDRDAAHSRPRRVHGISVIFTRSGADGAIIGRVGAARSPERIAVVTDDRGLAKAVKNAGAKVVAVEQLAKWLSDVKDSKGRPGKPRPDTGVGKKITDDLKDVWGA